MPGDVSYLTLDEYDESILQIKGDYPQEIKQQIQKRNELVDELRVYQFISWHNTLNEVIF